MLAQIFINFLIYFFIHCFGAILSKFGNTALVSLTFTAFLTPMGDYSAGLDDCRAPIPHNFWMYFSENYCLRHLGNGT